MSRIVNRRVISGLPRRFNPRHIPGIWLTAVIFIPLIMCSCRSTQGEVDARTQWESKISRQNREVEVRLREVEDMAASLKRDLVFLQQQLAGLESQLAKTEQERRTSLVNLSDQIKSFKDLLDRKTGIIMEEVGKELGDIRRLASKSSSGRKGEYMSGYEHVVQSGETLSTIATKYGTTVNAIAEASGLTNPNSIRVGQTIFVPAQ